MKPVGIALVEGCRRLWVDDIRDPAVLPTSTIVDSKKTELCHAKVHVGDGIAIYHGIFRKVSSDRLSEALHACICPRYIDFCRQGPTECCGGKSEGQIIV